MIKRILIVVSIALFVFALIPFMRDVTPQQKLPDVSDEYVENGPEELGAGNLVTSVVVTYRGLDTLGEVAVLFLAASGVGLLLRRDEGDAVPSVETDRTGPGKTGSRSDKLEGRESSEILQTASGLLLPLLILFGVYIFMHGHLTPGGGFQGGVIIASAFLLVFLAKPKGSASHLVLEMIESLSGAAYVGIGIAGLVLAAGFLDPRFLPLGEFGKLFSAGAIPIIYSLVGLKVGSELTGVLDNLKGRDV